MSRYLIGPILALGLLAVGPRPGPAVASPVGEWTLVQSWSGVQSSLTTPPVEVATPQWRVLITSEPVNPGPGANPTIDVTVYQLNGADRTRLSTIQADPAGRTERMQTGAGPYLLSINAHSTQWTVRVEALQ